MERETYMFHQTPVECAKDLINQLPLNVSDVLFEPFKGEGAFYDNFPAENPKLWAEIEQQKDYKDIQEDFDWVITNPPFRIETDKKKVNSFYFLLHYFSLKAKKGIAFLGNDYCFSTLTPKRLQELNSRGWFVSKIVVCSIKKWRGRYFFIVLQKQSNDFYKYLLKNYE